MLQGKAGLLLFDSSSLRRRFEKGLQELEVLLHVSEKPESFLKALKKDNYHFVMIAGALALAENCKLIDQIRSLPKQGIVPILAIGDRSDSDHFRQVIEAGADRFLDQTIEIAALKLEILSVLRRSQSFHAESERMDFGEVKISREKQEVWVLDSKVHVTAVEFKILLELLTKRGEVISRESLSQRYLSLRNSSDRTLDVHINALRRKLGKLGENLTTVRGRGYLFRLS